jgi:uncharacterized protein (TIGR02646 family)
MIAINFLTAKQTADIEVKQAAALQQMNDLHARLQSGPKYHTLTHADRELLKTEGYAADLIDNLVFITQRDNANTPTQQDKLITGFTYAAFDPALYATDSITTHLQQLNQGCCCYCESFLLVTDSGKVSHFRPVQLLDIKNDAQTAINNQCSPYFSLAYQQDNLVYCCPACDEKHKAGLFPITGARYPETSLEHEQYLLINPYKDDPRQYIRFNPINGNAYAYDLVRLFYRATQSLTDVLTDKEVSRLLWQQPSAIPCQTDADGNSISTDSVNTEYLHWLKNYTANGGLSRGQITIDTLGLNRSALVVSRLATLSQRRLNAWNEDQSNVNANVNANANANVNVNVNVKEPTNSQNHAYRSLALDALNTWHWQKEAKVAMRLSAVKHQENANHSENTALVKHDRKMVTTEPAIEVANKGVEGAISGADEGIIKGAFEGVIEGISETLNNNKAFHLPVNTRVKAFEFPLWFRASLRYFVSESELGQVNKRQLVCLSNKDRLYGGKLKEKCIFLPINWNDDTDNIIKVRSHRNVWESSFAELARSRPLELINLFTHNDIWVEGAFSALST